MDKMNQVSVTEFMSKSKEEMYDMAVEMVEKYNRLVDICNDSAERIAELIERHTVYTNALNKDIAAKAAKIDLMQKEIDGRKAGYVALKTQMDTKYISIEEHDMINKSLDEKVEIYEKEIERLNRYTTNLETANNNLVTRVASLESGKVAELEKELADCKVKIRHQKENLDGINKTLEIRNKENESLITVKNNQEREIVAHEEENARLTEKIMELKRTIEKCKDYDASLIDSLRINNDDLKNQVEYLKKELEDTYRTKEADLKNHNKRDMTLVDELGKKNDEIKKLKEENSRLNAWVKCDTEYWKKAFETQSVDLADEKKHNKELNEVITELKEERDKLKSFLKMQEDLTRDWKNKCIEAQREIDEWESDTSEHETITQYKEFIDGLNKDLSYWKEAYEVQSTSLAEVRKCNDELVDTLNKSSDRIDELEDELDHWKNQERIRTDQLRATESKVDELWRLVNELKKEKKEMDEYVKSGFKLYVKNTLTETEGNKNEANEIITEAVRSAYAEWGKEQKEKEEETEVKGVGRTSSGRYPWGAKVNDIPCGSDSIE